MPHFGNTNRDPQKSLVLFVVGDVHYAISIAQVAELVSPLPVTPLPHMPAEISGVADHRGDVIPVLDMRSHFALPPQASTRSTRWILINTGNRLVGLVVDRVIDVIGTKSEDMRSAATGGGRDLRGITTVTHYNGVLVFILDIKRFTEIVEDIADILPPYEG
jgi:purine-binding chemotaxis protein CheW